MRYRYDGLAPRDVGECLDVLCLHTGEWIDPGGLIYIAEVP
jgi:hypothetical protein